MLKYCQKNTQKLQILLVVFAIKESGKLIFL